jgi:pfkB family carbohydrate kinase
MHLLEVLVVTALVLINLIRLAIVTMPNKVFVRMCGMCLSNSRRLDSLPHRFHKRLSEHGVLTLIVFIFFAGFLAQLVQGGSLEDCIRSANYAANYIIQQSGCQLPDKPNFSRDSVGF